MFLADSELMGVSVTPAGRQLIVDVPWEAADNLRCYLRRHGVGTTVHLEPSTHTARLEPWAGVDHNRLQYLIAEWKGSRRPVACR